MKNTIPCPSYHNPRVSARRPNSIKLFPSSLIYHSYLKYERLDNLLQIRNAFKMKMQVGQLLKLKIAREEMDMSFGDNLARNNYMLSRLLFVFIRNIIIQMPTPLLAIYLIISTMSYVFKPAWQNQGKGARVLRIIGNQYLKNLDPFLMLDFFRVRLPAGFPDHPHRGFETVTYMLEGSFYHQDFKGHKGKIGPGDIQWMTAGKGIVHSQIPASAQQDSLGFQLWINLRKQNKLDPPAYQQFTADKIEVYNQENVKVKIIAGKWQGKTGPIYARTPSYYFDVQMLPGGKFDLPIPGDWNSIIFTYEGSVLYQNKTTVDKDHCCVLDKSNAQKEHKFTSVKGAKFVLIGGLPLNEPIKQYGPFVMNNQEEIYQAFQDYQSGTNGFQNANTWESTIKQMMSGKKIEEL